MTSLADYVAFTRPRSIPVTLVMAMTGWLASPRRDHATTDVVFLLVVYSILLWGGTNAFNSAADRDEGPVNLLPNPPPVPPHLGAFGLALMAAAIAAASLRGACCVVLAWWSRDPFTHAYRRMLRQMAMLTTAQLAWALAA